MMADLPQTREADLPPRIRVASHGGSENADDRRHHLRGKGKEKSQQGAMTQR